MKKFTLLAVVFILVSNIFAGERPWKVSQLNKRTNQEIVYHIDNKEIKKTKINKKSAQENKTWLPGTCTIFETYDNGKTWDQMDYIQYQYDNYDRVIVEESEYEKTTYTYDSHGNCIEQIKQIPKTDNNGLVIGWINSEKNVREYDNIVPSFQTVKQDFSWNASTNQWKQIYKHEKVVTRDQNNNVQSVIVRIYADETQYIDIEGFRVIYGNGKATSIISYEYDYNTNSMKAGQTLQDIVWEECGQILNIEYLCLNDVRAKSYDISYEGEVIASASVTYKTDGLFSCQKTTTDAFDDYTEIYTLTKLDNNGSYEESIEVEIAGTIEEGEKIRETYNEYKFQTEIVSYFYTGEEWEEGDRITMAPTYEDNKLMEVISSMTNPDSGIFEAVEKYVYGDHILSDIEDSKTFNGKVYLNPTDKNLYITTNEKADYAVYTIDGTQVLKGNITGAAYITTESLKNGIYIIHVNNGKTSTTLKFVK